MRNGYLFIYNMTQWVGWLMIFYHLVFGRQFSQYLQTLVEVFQLLALLEIAHSIMGIVRASWVTTFVQVMGRLQVLWVIHKAGPIGVSSSGVFPMLLAWSSIEIVRYLYLALNIYGLSPYVLTWLRYTLFYVLYPLGVYGEMRTIYDSLGAIGQAKILSYTLPNPWNFCFSYAGFLRFFLAIVYVPAFLNQYVYMMGQRKVVLGRLGSVECKKVD